MLCSHCHVRLVAIVIALALSATAPLAQSGDVAADNMVEAIWHVQSLTLEYDSTHAHYACDSLERKVRGILQAVGAHDSVAVKARCMDAGLLNQASVQIVLATPMPASEENIRMATTFTARDELLAKMRKTTLPTPANIPRFVATWRTLELSRAPRVRLDVGDCDLLQNMNQQVFSRLAVRLTNENLNCSASATRVRPRFELRALIPTPLNPVARTGPQGM